MAHEPHECENCVFVVSRESIYIDPKLAQKLTTKPVFVGNFALPGWSGHLRFYAFICPECGARVVDYTHGYTNGNFLFFCCDSCGDKDWPTVLPVLDKEVYIAESTPLPVVLISIKSPGVKGGIWPLF